MGSSVQSVRAKLGQVCFDNFTKKTVTQSTTAPVTGFPATPFLVTVLIPDLNIRSAPSMNGAVKGVTGKGTFTITQVSGDWGKLKSGAGWIYLQNPSYCKIQ